MNQMNAAFDVVETITSMGFEALIVGGAVRDLILGVEPHDIDIATNCPLDLVEDHWPSHDIGKSKDFGIITVEHLGHQFEVANFRQDSAGSDGRRPDSIQIAASFKEDASRRDFTFNALALDVNGNIVDFHGGREALAKGLIVTVGDPETRFGEDFLRIIRAVRFAARLDFHIQCDTEKAIMDSVCHLPRLSAERIHDELFKMAALGGKRFAHAIEIMHSLGVLDIIMPEVSALKTVHETERWHPEAHAFGTGTSFDHTMQALRASTSFDALTNMAVLLHDVGKGVTHKFNEEKNAHQFHGHDMAAAPLLDALCKRLKFSNEEKEAVMFAATQHMKMTNLTMKPTKIVALVSNKNWGLIKHVSWCDDASRMHLFDAERFNNNINTMENIASKWMSTDRKAIKVVSGDLVQEITGLKPCRRVGEIIARVTEMLMDEGRQEPIEELIKEVWNEN